MDLFLIRHAPAVPAGEGRFDHARPLSPKGRTRFEDEVDGLENLGLEFQRVYHSPWVRARQTAELLAPISDRAVELEDLAKPPGRPLLGQLTGDYVAVVGHQPWLGDLTSLLLLGATKHGDRFPFKKGSVAHLRGEAAPGRCVLVSVLGPKALRRLGD